MPYMISDKALHIARNGVDARLAANEVCFVKPILEATAREQGARDASEPTATPKGRTETPKPQAPDDDQVRDVLHQLMAEGDPKLFGADGLPKTRELNKALGVKISASQRDRVWEQMPDER